MSSDESKDLEARTKQSKADKKNTLAKLLSKRRKTRTVKFSVNGETLDLTFQAISSHELDALRAKHPPTVEQKANGFSVNQDTFQPALVAACLTDPEMTYEEAKEMWASEHWSHGELNNLFNICSDLCLEGLDIPSSASV